MIDVGFQIENGFNMDCENALNRPEIHDILSVHIVWFFGSIFPFQLGRFIDIESTNGCFVFLVVIWHTKLSIINLLNDTISSQISVFVCFGMVIVDIFKLVRNMEAVLM